MPKILWTKEEDEFLKENVSGISFKELSELLNAEYGYERRTQYACQRRCTKLGITNGRDTTFQKGVRNEWPHKPGISRPKVLPIGTLRIVNGKKHGESRTKLVYIKISDEVCANKTKGHSVGNNKNWIPYGRYVWEQVHGPLDKDQVLVHLDGDSLNNSIENLEAIPK